MTKAKAKTTKADQPPADPDRDARMAAAVSQKLGCDVRILGWQRDGGYWVPKVSLPASHAPLAESKGLIVAERIYRRTGCRKPLNHLKVWSPRSAASWTRRVTPRLHVSMVDEELPYRDTDDSRNPDRIRKSWYLALTQDRDLAKELGPVWGLPKKGKTLLLFEDDLIALVQYLIDGDLIGSENGTVFNALAEEFEEGVFERSQAQAKAAKAAKRSQRKAKASKQPSKTRTKQAT